MDALTQLVTGIRSGAVKVVDLTKPLGPMTPVISLPPPFADAPSFRIDNLSRYDSKGPAWYWNVLHVGEHTGTHFDAPIHWVTGKDLSNNGCDTISASCFVAPVVVINAVESSQMCPDYLLPPEAVLSWEERYGRICGGSWVFMRTDWSKRLGAEEFLNTDERGPHSPGFHPETVRFLLRDRQILGIGVETVGIDGGQAYRSSPPFPNHALVLGAGRYGLASLSQLDQVSAVGSIVVAAPLKIVDGSGSPIRAFALVPDSNAE